MRPSRFFLAADHLAMPRSTSFFLIDASLIRAKLFRPFPSCPRYASVIRFSLLRKDTSVKRSPSPFAFSFSCFTKIIPFFPFFLFPSAGEMITDSSGESKKTFFPLPPHCWSHLPSPVSLFASIGVACPLPFQIISSSFNCPLVTLMNFPRFQVFGAKRFLFSLI